MTKNSIVLIGVAGTMVVCAIGAIIASVGMSNIIHRENKECEVDVKVVDFIASRGLVKSSNEEIIKFIDDNKKYMSVHTAEILNKYIH